MTYRKTSATNLIAGVILIVLGVGGMVSLTFGNVDANLLWGIAFAALLILVGGYETGKYAEMRHQQRKSDK